MRLIYGFTCQACQKEFEVPKSLTSDKTRSFYFCSSTCYNQNRAKFRKGGYLTCQTCSTIFYVTAGRVRQATKNNVTIRYCSQKCYVKTGDKNPFWGKKQKPESIAAKLLHPNNYSFPTGRANPNYTKWEYSPFKRTATESVRHTLRALLKACERCGWADEVAVLQVHHKDRNNKNNAKENLILVCPNCHYTDHFRNQDGPWRKTKKKRKPRPIILE